MLNEKFKLNSCILLSQLQMFLYCAFMVDFFILKIFCQTRAQAFNRPFCSLFCCYNVWSQQAQPTDNINKNWTHVLCGFVDTWQWCLVPKIQQCSDV